MFEKTNQRRSLVRPSCPDTPEKGLFTPLATGAAQLSIGKSISSSLQSAANKCVYDAIFNVAKGRDIPHIVADEISILRQIHRFGCVG